MLVLASAGCGGSSKDDAGSFADLATHNDAAGSDAAGSDAATTLDGTPTRQACTGHFGSGLTAAHGRLDGTLVAVIAPGAGAKCNGDDSHVHLQVQMQSAVYDVAVDIGATGDEIYYLTKDIPIPDGAWAEGWHTSDAFDYVSMGLASTDFAALQPADAATTVENALTSVNHISVFGTGYNENGMHLVHYESGSDGAIVTQPLSGTAHVLLFRFAADHF